MAGPSLADPPRAQRSDRLASCSWDSPGHNPFIGDVVAAVDRYGDIPAPVRATLKRRMQARQYDDIAAIRRDSIAGERSYEPQIRDGTARGRICGGRALPDGGTGSAHRPVRGGPSGVRGGISQRARGGRAGNEAGAEDRGARGGGNTQGGVVRNDAVGQASSLSRKPMQPRSSKRFVPASNATEERISFGRFRTGWKPVLPLQACRTPVA